MVRFAAFDLHVCLDTFSKDVHTELIQHKRQWMIKRGFLKGNNLWVNSAKQRLKGSCPLMPEEVRYCLGTRQKHIAHPRDEVN